MSSQPSGGGVRDQAVPLGSPGACLCRLVFTIPRRRGGYENVEQFVRRPRDLVNRAFKGELIRLRRSSKTTQFTNKLQCRCTNLVVCGWWLKVMQCLDIATHRQS